MIEIVEKALAPQSRNTQASLAKRIARQPLFALKITKMAVNAAEDQQGRKTAIDHAFALHHLGHSHAQEVYGLKDLPED